MKQFIARKGTALILMVMLMGTLFVPMTADAAAQGYPTFHNVKKNSFGMGYYAVKKGTYKADLYKTNKNGKKISYIRTVKFNCKKKVKSGIYRYYGSSSFSKASKNTYYTLFPHTRGHNRSFTVKTKK